MSGFQQHPDLFPLSSRFPATAHRAAPPHEEATSDVFTKDTQQGNRRARRSLRISASDHKEIMQAADVVQKEVLQAVEAGKERIQAIVDSTNKKISEIVEGSLPTLILSTEIMLREELFKKINRLPHESRSRY